MTRRHYDSRRWVTYSAPAAREAARFTGPAIARIPGTGERDEVLVLGPAPTDPAYARVILSDGTWAVRKWAWLTALPATAAATAKVAALTFATSAAKIAA